MAAGFVIGGSVFLMLTVFDTLTNLNSVEMRDEITEVLRSPTGEGLGISMSQALASMRVGLMIAGACAAAAAVLGVYVLQRNRGARLALSILAVPILLTAPLTGGIIGALVAVATLMLWSGPARDWFAGRPVRDIKSPGRSGKPGKPGPWETTMPRPSDRLNQPDQTPPQGHDPVPSPDQPSDQPSDRETPEDQPTPPASELTTAGTSTAPGASTGFGVRPARVEDRPHGTWPQPATTPAATTPPPGATWGAGPSTVPAPVKIACILTWVFSGLVALMYAGVLVALIAIKDQIVDYVVDTPEWQRSELQQDMLVPVLWLGVLMFLGWALGACVLAFFTWRRHNWARWLLAASAATTFVIAMFAFPVGILHQLAAVLTIVGLFLSTSRTWFEQDAWGNTWQGPPAGPPPASYPHGPPQDGPPQGGPPQHWPPQDGPPQHGPPPDGPAPDAPAQDRPPQDRPRGGKPPVW
jgi:hypothetical protein